MATDKNNPPRRVRIHSGDQELENHLRSGFAEANWRWCVVKDLVIAIPDCFLSAVCGHSDCWIWYLFVQLVMSKIKICIV